MIAVIRVIGLVAIRFRFFRSITLYFHKSDRVCVLKRGLAEHAIVTRPHHVRWIPVRPGAR